MAAPKIGQLKNRLTFQRDVSTPDGSGGYSSVKVTDFELWGFITKVSDFYQQQVGQEINYNAVEIWVMYQADLLPIETHIIVCGDYYYTVNGIKQVNEDRRWVVIAATRNVNVEADEVILVPTFDSSIVTFDSTLITFDHI